MIRTNHARAYSALCIASTALPGQMPLITLCDAALHLTKLPKAEHQAPERQAAAEVLMSIGENGGDPVCWLTWGYCCKSRSLNDSENLAKVDF